MMKKYQKLIIAIGTFLLCIPLHFLYEWCSLELFVCFLPVNESLFEHMKLIFTSIFIVNCIILLFKKNTTFINAYLSALFSIPLFLICYLPIYYRFGEQMIITLLLLFLTIYLSIWIKEFLDKYLSHTSITDSISIVLVIATYIFAGYLTYNPPHTDFFFDPIEEKYGLYDYRI